MSVFINIVDVLSEITISGNEFPIVPVEVLSIELVSNWGNPLCVGLNGIDLFDVYDRKVEMNQFSDIILQYCRNASPCDNLFRPTKRTIHAHEQWTTLTDWKETPKIVVLFEHPKQIARLAIYNFNALDDDAGIGTMVSLMFPYSMTFLFGWTVLFIIWMLIGIPVGF